MTEEQLQQAMSEIDNSPMTSRQKIKAKAELMLDYRVITGAPRSYANKTSLGRVFGQSLVRSLATNIIRSIFR
jgi:hypothetical protein